VVVSRKAALSALISVLLFAVFTALAFTGLFDLVEARFYNPAVVRAISREIDADAHVIEEFFDELQIRFAATLEEEAVRRSFLSGQESEDIALRASLYGELMESLGGLQSVRFIDSGGRRIHFSTWQPDILRRDRNSIAYRNYGAEENSAAYIPYGQVESAHPRLIFDGARERIVFSHPFYDSFDVYRGTALFSLSVRAVVDRMASAGRIKIGENVSVVSEPPGLVTGLPSVGRSVLLPLIAGVWSENSLSLSALNSDITGLKLALISRKTDQNIYTGRLVNQSLLGFSLAMRSILLISFLITVFLIIFLMLNLRQDAITVIQSRLKKLQVNLLEEYRGHTGDVNWNRWKKDLEHRREDVRAELKRGLNTRGKGFAEIDDLIDRSWDDLVAIIDGRMERRFGIEEDARRAFPGGRVPETAVPEGSAGMENPEALEALNEADIVEALEGPARGQALLEAPEPELEELETGEAELVELEAGEADEPEELEALDDAEELAESAGAETVQEAPEPDLEELEAGEAELVELEADEPEELEAPDDSEELAENAGAETVQEAPEPDLEELEAVEPDTLEPPGGGPGSRVEFYRIDPLEFDDPGESETDIDNLVSAIEFSPDSQEREREKEEEARSMAENFEIQSPFASIFSSLSEKELEPDPVEALESLTREGPERDDSPETEAEKLRLSYTGAQLSVPFLEALNSDIAFLMAEEEEEDVRASEEAAALEAAEQAPEDTETGDPETGQEQEETGGFIIERDGVFYIDESVLNPGRKTLKGLDRNFKNLIDSILNNA
jgi:hypothetical protein